MGENVTATLRGNESFDWVVLNNREKAIEGVSRARTMLPSLSPKRLALT